MTPTLNSLPSRRLARRMAEKVHQNFDGPFQRYQPSEFDLRYNNAETMKRIRSMIAAYGNRQLFNDLKEAWACWHAQDGSIDLRQRSNEFHMVSWFLMLTSKQES